MGYDLSKRVTELQLQVDQDLSGRIGLRGASVIAVIAVFFLVTILSAIFPPLKSDDWAASTRDNVNRRIDWLDRYPVGGPGSADRYQSLAQIIVDSFLYQRTDGAVENSTDPNKKKPFFDAEGVIVWATQATCNFLLRTSFVLLSFWPFWLIGGAVGWFILGKHTRIVPTKDLLGICSRGDGPFYSGIFGPLRPNNGIAGTDMSVPSLACPPMVAAATALNHQLCKTLRQFGAYNETNLNLIRIILAHADYPSLVEDESPADEEEDTEGEVIEPSRLVPANSAFTTNAGGTIEKSSLEGLRAILEAHRGIGQVLPAAQKNQGGGKVQPNSISAPKTTATPAANMPADLFLKTLHSTAAQISPLGRLLLGCLTQNRARALQYFDPKKIATAYLATEAGKSLVYRREEGGFVRISRFPHLQARAVVQSVGNYHEEYNGDDRLIIRQSILSSRRHGDFGRAFLPVDMQMESRALRDWLEILYSQNKHLAETAQLVELDAHIEEIGTTWNREFYTRIRRYAGMHPQAAAPSGPWWKGVVWRSIVLMPLKDVVDIALAEVEPARLHRIGELLGSTRSIQASISTAVRLPGFKRQATEALKSGLDADSIVQGLAQAEGGKQLLERWIVVRRMLNRNNWLSTRLGDDAVSVDGLVQAIVIDRSINPDRPEVIGFDALVPLRQRRFKELLGSRWDVSYYGDSSHPMDIEPFSVRDRYLTILEQRKRESEHGQLGLASRSRHEPAAPATAQ